MTNFMTISQLLEGIQQHPIYQHQIKGKRVKKQLNSLKDKLGDNFKEITFQKYLLSDEGISFYIQLHRHHRVFQFEILLNQEYPFERPKIMYIHESSCYANGLDLLDTVIEGNWGPSKLLSEILEAIPDLVQKLCENKDVQSIYSQNDILNKTFLQRYNIKQFKVDQNIWKYKIIKTTKEKMLGLTKQYLIIFEIVEQGVSYKVEEAIKIKDIQEANANLNKGSYTLSLSFMSEGLHKNYYFVGLEEDVQKILYFMNPVQMIERKVTKQNMENISPEKEKQLINHYSQLIEHYSMKDQQKTKQYIKKLQDLIMKGSELKQKEEEKVEEMMEEEIKT